MKTAQRDMTKGSPSKIILEFTIPLFIGNLFQQFYNMVDAVIVGQFVGTGALAAVGSTGTIMFLVTGLAMGMTNGFTLQVAQRFGANDIKGMRRAAVNATILAAIVSVVMTTISVLMMKPLLTFMHTPEDIFADAYSYIIIICAGLAAPMLYNLLSCLMRALGNSKIPLFFLIIAASLNILLDLLFIIQFKMGTAGAAWATIISQGISGLLCLLYIIKAVPILHPHKEDLQIDPHMMAGQLRIGVPMALQFSITAIGSMMVQTSLNMLGSIYVAALTTASKIEQLTTQAYVALGTAMANYAAQNIGAGDVARIRKGFRSATIMGIIYSVVAGVLVMTFGKYLTYMFISDNVESIIDSVGLYLICSSSFYIPLTIVNLYRNGIQGLGYGLLPMTAGIAELIGRGVVAMIAAEYHSYLGICLAGSAAWALAAGLLLVQYFYIIHHDLSKLPPKPAENG